MALRGGFLEEGGLYISTWSSDICGREVEGFGLCEEQSLRWTGAEVVIMFSGTLKEPFVENGHSD